MKARPEKPEIVEAAKEWESTEAWKGDYCSSIKLTSFSFKWLAQLVNQLELEEVMEVERGKWWKKTRDTNKRIRRSRKKRKQTHTTWHSFSAPFFEWGKH